MSGNVIPQHRKSEHIISFYPLVRIEAEKLTCHTQDSKYLPGRDLNAIQQKFAKLKKVSPYKEQWNRFKNGKGKQAMLENRQRETDGDGDEN